ncbi:adaptin ear-binding coat-associated protein 1 [Willisornis vidua]|uniref:Adaptin ear-binding coat-associated protein 1 n=1 Tax=Willisornis vidua TaxID=1566151 RepID=A0ABQ9DDF6_9PASS|nr:adaptin ear-binding coat-associated protein 1 [Willisornis vidua]
MSNKQEELETLAQSQRFDITGINERWWDESSDWNALLDGCKPFIRYRQGRRGPLMYAMQRLECMEEVTAGNNIPVRIKGQTNNVDVIIGVYYRPPGQDYDVDKLFLDELRDTSKSTALVLMGNFNLPEINCEHHTADTTWARRFLKILDDNFMEQVLMELTQKDALLDLLLVNGVDPVSEGDIGGCLGHSDHEVIEFEIL